MQIKKISQEIALATVSVTIALFQIGVLTPATLDSSIPVVVEADTQPPASAGLTDRFATQPPASADSNRKKDLNTPYVVTLDEIRAFYVQAEAGAMQGITIDEGVLHGTLAHNGREVVAGDYFSVTQLAQGFVYTPEKNFQGADHFKFQTEDLYNLGNVSSFNFDIINGAVFHRENSGSETVEDDKHEKTETPETGFGSGGEIGSPEPKSGSGSEENTEDVASPELPLTVDDADEKPQAVPNGTGAGGFPEDVEPLVRTGGADSQNDASTAAVITLAALSILSGFALQIRQKS